MQNKKGHVAVVDRSPSQSTSEFESFFSGLEDLLSNALCSKSQFIVVLGDLNAISPACWSGAITTLHGTQIDSLTTMHGFKQIISDPTHILPHSSSCIDLHKQVTIFNQTLVNIFLNHIPNKLITDDDKDPPRMNERIKKKIMAKKHACKSFNANKKNYDAYLKLQTISTELSEMILKRKEDYYCALSDKLNDPHNSAKSYWSILKTLYNGKKIPLIPPIFISNKLVSNFKEKANHFNAFFASQGTPVPNNSTLPLVTTPITNASLSSILFNDQDILNVIHSLNINKVHGFDDLSIRLLKICDSSIVKPLSIVLKNCLRSRSFPNNWKKSNVVPIHKKGGKQLLQNHWPVSLLPICGKIFERIIFNPIFEDLEKNSLLWPNQFGFHPFDSCENQLLSIVHDIYANFDQNPTLEMRANFLDISKAFDKVWHEGLLFKLEYIGISGNLPSLLESFLSNRFQRVVLNGQCCSWS